MSVVTCLFSLRARLPLQAVLLILPLLTLTGCKSAQQPVRKNRAAEVVVTRAQEGDVCNFQDFTGRLDAYRTVSVRPRVTGYIEKAEFREGELVKKDQVLFTIDPSLYRADFDQAEGNLRQAIAERNLQLKNAARSQQLYGSQAMGKEEYDQIQAAAEKAGATVRAMEAARDRARINLEYTEVRAPIAGRISRRNVDPGNLVNADNTVLTTIVTEEPVYAYFDVDERTYLKLVTAAEWAQSSSAPIAGLHLPVLMRLVTEDDFTQRGQVNFLDNRLNENTGTVRMRGEFDNPRSILKAGLFIRVRLPVGTPRKALLIPDEAILSDQGSKYVFAVREKEGKTIAAYQAVEVGQSIQGLRVVTSGLEPSDRFIVKGMQRVRPGAEIQITEEQKPAPYTTPPLVKLLQQEREAAATEPARSSHHEPAPREPARSPRRQVRPGKGR